jgi:hypothetical protein
VLLSAFVPLYDANGKPIYSGGVTHDDIVAAIQAAALADEFSTAEEIADRHDMKGICLCCALKGATTAHYDRDNIIRRVCITCFHKLNDGVGQTSANFSSMKMYTHGLVKRDVQ